MRFDKVKKSPTIGRPSSKAAVKPKPTHFLSLVVIEADNQVRTSVLPLAFLNEYRNLVRCHLLRLEIGTMQVLRCSESLHPCGYDQTDHGNERKGSEYD
jgi:hypothetical protein